MNSGRPTDDPREGDRASVNEFVEREPDPGMLFPSPPRPGGPSLVAPAVLIVTGLVTASGNLYLNEPATYEMRLGIAGVGYALLALGARMFKVRSTGRPFWRQGRIVAGAILQAPRFRPEPVWLMAAMLAPAGVLMFWNHAYSYVALVAAAAYVATHWVLRWLNAVRVLYWDGDEAPVAMLPSFAEWKRLRGEDSVWVATRGKRAALLSAVAPKPYRDFAVDYATEDALLERMEEFVAKHGGNDADED